jgi:drug/metabolite transporter (DMT)-like permease
MKIGSNQLSDFSSIFNLYLISGLVFYAIGAVLLIIALKYGDLSMIYPFIALSFIWVTILSTYIFNEHVSVINWLGIIAILLGVSLIGQGGRK